MCIRDSHCPGLSIGVGPLMGIVHLEVVLMEDSNRGSHWASDMVDVNGAVGVDRVPHNIVPMSVG